MFTTFSYINFIVAFLFFYLFHYLHLLSLVHLSLIQCIYFVIFIAFFLLISLIYCAHQFYNIRYLSSLYIGYDKDPHQVGKGSKLYLFCVSDMCVKCVEAYMIAQMITQSGILLTCRGKLEDYWSKRSRSTRSLASYSWHKKVCDSTKWSCTTWSSWLLV